MTALRALAGPALPPEMLPLLSMDRPEALMAMAGGEAAALSQVQGLDRTRPLLLRLGEAPDDFDGAVATAMGRAPSQLRHVLVLPATESAVLRASLAEKAGQLCRSATASTFQCDDHLLSLFEHGSWVVASLSRAPVALAELVASPGGEGTLAWALDARRPMSLHFRMREARGVAMFYGAERMNQAMLSMRASPADRGAAVAEGIQSIFRAFVHMSAFGQEIETAALSLRASPASVLGVAQLTSTGESRISAPSSAALGQATPAMVTVRSHYHLRSLTASTPDAFTFADARSPREVSRPLNECGAGCMLRVLAEPFGYAHTVSRIGAEEFNEIVAFVQDDALAPGVIDVEFDNARIAEEAGEPELTRMAASVPRGHLHSQVQGRMWAGALGHSPNLPLEAAGLGTTPPRPEADDAHVACFQTLAETTLGALDSLRRSSPAERRATLAAAAQAQEAQRRCVTAPTLRGEAEAYLSAVQQISAALAE